jgi:hypothetical protein
MRLAIYSSHTSVPIGVAGADDGGQQFAGEGAKPRRRPAAGGSTVRTLAAAAAAFQPGDAVFKHSQLLQKCRIKLRRTSCTTQTHMHPW